MTAHDKVMYIIEQLGLPDSRIAKILRKSRATITQKRLNINGRTFKDKDFLAIREHYINVLRDIERLDEYADTI